MSSTRSIYAFAEGMGDGDTCINTFKTKKELREYYIHVDYEYRASTPYKISIKLDENGDIVDVTQEGYDIENDEYVPVEEG